jgi:hypothetical protein
MEGINQLLDCFRTKCIAAFWSIDGDFGDAVSYVVTDV